MRATTQQSLLPGLGTRYFNTVQLGEEIPTRSKTTVYKEVFELSRTSGNLHDIIHSRLSSDDIMHNMSHPPFSKES